MTCPIKNRLLRSAGAALALLLCMGGAFLIAPRSAQAAAYTVPGDAASIADALAKGDATQITLQGVTDDSVSQIPAGVTVVLSGNPTLATSGELSISGAVTGVGAISASAVFVTRSGSVASGVSYSGPVCWEQNIGVAGVTKIVGSDGRDSSPMATSGGYYKTTVRYPTAVYVGNDKYAATGSGFSREYTITYVSQDPKTACTNSNPTAYTAATPSFALQNPTVTYPDYTFVQWQWADGTKVAFLNPAQLTGDLTIYAVWKSAGKSAGGSGSAGRSGGGVAGGGSGTFSTAADTLTDADEDDSDEVETVAATPGFGNMRVRMASSTTRHTLASEKDTDVQEMANLRASGKTFPWQWVGTGLGALALLIGLGLALKRRADEKTAAMMEKLNIKE